MLTQKTEKDLGIVIWPGGIPALSLDTEPQLKTLL